MCFPIRSSTLNTLKIPMRQGLSYAEGIQIQDESGINTLSGCQKVWYSNSREQDGCFVQSSISYASDNFSINFLKFKMCGNQVPIVLVTKTDCIHLLTKSG